MKLLSTAIATTALTLTTATVTSANDFNTQGALYVDGAVTIWFECATATDCLFQIVEQQPQTISYSDAHTVASEAANWEIEQGRTVNHVEIGNDGCTYFYVLENSVNPDPECN